MRLLNTSTLKLVAHLDPSTRPPYAILSHRWFDYPDEIRFADIGVTDLKETPPSSRGLAKIQGTCRKAREHGIDWVWIDSCCINRDDPEELSTSINKMFQWYREATVCFAYLSDVVAAGRRAPTFARIGVAGQASEWFDRGWTLQELLAPQEVAFFDRNWRCFGTRSGLRQQIAHLTGIMGQFLDGPDSLHRASIAQKMSWQASRTTTKEEDIAYSMVGILGVLGFFPQYGEGQSAAFKRLQEALLVSNADESLFAWTVPLAGGSSAKKIAKNGNTWGLLAPGIDCFRDSSNIDKAPDAAIPRHEVGCQLVQGSCRIPMPIGDHYSENIGGGVQYDRLFTLMWLHGVPGNQVRYWWKEKRHRDRPCTPLHLKCYRDGSLVKIWLRQADVLDAWERCECGTLEASDARYRNVEILSQMQHRIGKVYGMDEALWRDGWKDVTVLQP